MFSELALSFCYLYGCLCVFVSVSLCLSLSWFVRLCASLSLCLCGARLCVRVPCTCLCVCLCHAQLDPDGEQSSIAFDLLKPFENESFSMFCLFCSIPFHKTAAKHALIHGRFSVVHLFFPKAFFVFFCDQFS